MKSPCHPQMPPSATATRKRRLYLSPLPRLCLLVLFFRQEDFVGGVEILSKSRLERCVKVSDSDKLDCNKKVVVNVAVPSGSSGGEASIVAELVEVEGNDTNKMQTIREPPVITINKSAAYALYELMYIRDVPYKPEEFYVKTRKCEPDASAKVVQICERLRDQDGHIIEHTQPICCPCGPSRRVPSSCGNLFDKLMKGKANTAHCLRFPGEWFHVFGIGRRSLGFSVRIEVKNGPLISEVIVGPENRTALSTDNFLRVSLIGDFVGYTSIPSFEDFYLVTPQLGTVGHSQNTGMDFSKWMLLERVRFTLDGLECNKIGVSYEAYNGQPNFCSSPLWSCLHNQLWNFWEADQNRISRNQPPQYVIEGRFERINQHPNAGTHSFSIGITEVLNTNLLIELSADDIDYVYQRSPGKIVSINIPTFEALTQFGTATVAVKNIGKLEASYSLTFECLRGVSHTEEQFFIMKPDEVASRSFKLYPTTDQAAKYECTAVLKDSDFSEIDRAECQFSTTATVLDNGSQITFSYGLKKGGINGFFEAIGSMWASISGGLAEFFTGKSCSQQGRILLSGKVVSIERDKCSGFFDFGCHIQYICISWIIMFGLLVAILPTVTVLLWLLHQKGFFDPLYDWWDDRCEPTNRKVLYRKHHKDTGHAHACHNGRHLHPRGRHYHHDAQNKRRGQHPNGKHHIHAHSEFARIDDHHNSESRRYLHVRTETHKHKHSRKFLNELPSQIRKKGKSYMKRNPERLVGQRLENPLYSKDRYKRNP